MRLWTSPAAALMVVSPEALLPKHQADAVAARVSPLKEQAQLYVDAHKDLFYIRQHDAGLKAIAGTEVWLD